MQYYLKSFFILVQIQCVISITLYGQLSNLGNPPIISYSKKTVNGGTQTWAIAEDDFGYTWFGNNAGLLKFDGYTWELLPIPNATKIRSIGIDNRTHTIYTGGQGDFGYFRPDSSGIFRYTSLIDNTDSKLHHFGDVWNVLVTKEHGIFFRTDHQIFRYYQGSVVALFPEGYSFNFIGKWGQEVVMQDEANQLYIFNGQKFVKKPEPSKFDLGRISSVINYTPDTILITTINNGIFYESASGFIPWKTSDDALLKSKIIYCADKTKDGKIMIGSSFTGLIIIDKQRRIETNINKSSGLQNNSVLSIHATRNGNVWLGLDNGIDLVNIKSSFRQFYPDNELQGTGYAVALFENALYFGTNTGLYKIDWKKYYLPEEKNRFELIPQSKGQVWKLQKINDELWMGHHNGAYLIKENAAKKISDILGIWKFVPFGQDMLVAGNYQGLAVIEKYNNTWRQNGVIKGFKESARIMDQDISGNLWIAHPYRGIYFVGKRDINEKQTNERLYHSDYLANIKLKNQIFQIGGRILAIDHRKFYGIETQPPDTVRFAGLSEQIPLYDGLRFMFEDDYNNIWYGTGKETGLLVPERKFEGGYKKYIIKELSGRLTEGHESALTIDKENVLFPTDKGFLLFNADTYIHDTTPVRLFLSRVLVNAFGDSVLYQGSLLHQQKPITFRLQPGKNSILFQFSVKDYPDKELIEYAHFLKGGDKKWSEWSPNPDLNFNKLAPGNYELLVKARNQSGVESNIVSVTLIIPFPWYQSLPAYLGYIIFLAGFGYYLITRQKKKYEFEKQTIQEENMMREKEHILNARLNREEIIRLQNEKLQTELNFKNQELTSFTYHLVTKNELIAEIKKAINKLEPKFEKDKELRKEFKNIIQLTELNANIDADWDNFIKNFDQVHSEFFKRLNEEFSELSPNDYKMCTYLRMNLTSKEIATLMNISIRSVETNRYRLRKKLGLSQEANLTQFLLRY